VATPSTVRRSETPTKRNAVIVRLMPASYRIRLELADQPGALAAIAGAIASHEANVTAIDIHQPISGRAVDEIVLDAPDARGVAALADAIASLDGVQVLHVEAEDRTGDATVSALRWSRVMLASGEEGSDLELTRAMLEVSRASVAWVLGVAAAAAVPVGRIALDGHEPATVTVDALPAGVEIEAAGPYCLTAIPDDPTDPRTVGFAARPATVPFSGTESTRLQALLALHHQVVTLMGRAVGHPRSAALRR
jgi:hypothetical protein